VIVAKVEWILGPFFIWCRGKWDNHWCDGWFCCHGTCCIEVSVCMGLGLGLTGCIGGIFGQKCLCFFPVKALRSSSPNSLLACDHQSRCCAQALSNCNDYHCNGVLELRLIWQLSSVVRVCGSARPPIC
jgi:hypothetical protein